MPGTLDVGVNIIGPINWRKGWGLQTKTLDGLIGTFTYNYSRYHIIILHYTTFKRKLPNNSTRNFQDEFDHKFDYH